MQTMFFSKIVAVSLLLCISSLMQEVSSYRNREKKQNKTELEQKKVSVITTHWLILIVCFILTLINVYVKNLKMNASFFENELNWR